LAEEKRSSFQAPQDASATPLLPLVASVPADPGSSTATPVASSATPLAADPVTTDPGDPASVVADTIADEPVSPVVDEPAKRVSVPIEAEPESLAAVHQPSRRARRITRRDMVARPTRSSGRRSVRGTLIALLLVPGLFGTVALPAFSLPDAAADANAQLTSAGEQSLVVSADAENAPLERDAYSATSVDDLITARAASGYSYDAAAAMAAYNGPSSQGWWRPVPGEITSPYGPRNLICNSAGCSNSFHEGMDFGNDCGTPIRAANAGTVTFVGNAGAYGNRVIIDHGDGLETVYGHIQPRSFEVEVGDVVSGGQHIANVGATGVVNGCHLDLKVMIDGETTDPAPFLITHGVPV